MVNKHNLAVAKTIMDNIRGVTNPGGSKGEVLSKPIFLSQESMTITTDINTDLGVSDSNIDGVFGYKDLRFWYGKYSNNTKSFIAISNIQDVLMEIAPNIKVIRQINIQNTLIDIPLIKYFEITGNGELYGLWNYNSKIHFFRLVHFIDQIGKLSLTSIYPIVNIDVETVTTIPNGIVKGYTKFNDYDLINIAKDEIENGLFAFVIWKNSGYNDKKIRFIQINTSDIINPTWEINEDISFARIKTSLGTDFNGVSSLTVKTNKTKFENVKEYNDDKILGSIWFATKSGSTSTNPTNLNIIKKTKGTIAKQEYYFQNIIGDGLPSPIPKDKNFDIEDTDELLKIISDINKIEAKSSTTNFNISEIDVDFNFKYLAFNFSEADRTQNEESLLVSLKITDPTEINNFMKAKPPINKPNLGVHTEKQEGGIIEKRITITHLIFVNNEFVKQIFVKMPLVDVETALTIRSYYKVDIDFKIKYSYTKNESISSINSASQILISKRNNKKQDTWYYDLAQTTPLPIIDSHRAIALNYLKAYYPLKSVMAWSIIRFNGARGLDYNKPSYAVHVNKFLIFSPEQFIIEPILDEQYGTTIVGVGSLTEPHFLGLANSTGFNIYDGNGDGDFLGFTEVEKDELQEIKSVVGNRQENLIVWSAYNSTFTQKLNYMQVYPNSLSPYTLIPYTNYFQTTVIKRISIRKGYEFKDTKFDRKIVNSQVSKNVLVVTTIAQSEDLNDTNNDTIALLTNTNEVAMLIPTTNYQNKDRRQKIEINVSTTFKWKINNVVENIPSNALARIHNFVKQEDLDHLQIKSGIVEFSDGTNKSFNPKIDASWYISTNKYNGLYQLHIDIALVQHNQNKYATSVKILSKKNDVLGRIDLTTFPCSQINWWKKMIQCNFIILIA